MFLGLFFIFISLTVLILVYKHFYSIGKLKDIKNKHIVITGGSSGIGKAVGIECAKRGAHITIIARNSQKLAQAVEEIKRACLQPADQKISYISANVTNSTEIEQCIAQLDAQIPIFMLVNCAGMALYNVLENMSVDEINTIINLNLYGTIYTTRAVLPLLKARQDGIIVVTASQGAFLGVYGGAAYTASKYALRGFAEVLYFETKIHNVSVTLSLPADTDTPGFENEEKTKPLETRLICEEGGLLKPNAVAKQLVLDALQSKFYSYNPNMATFCVSMVNAGMSPPSNYGELILQILLMGPLRLISFIYLKSFEKIIEQCKRKREQEKKYN